MSHFEVLFKSGGSSHASKNSCASLPAVIIKLLHPPMFNSSGVPQRVQRRRHPVAAFYLRLAMKVKTTRRWAGLGMLDQ